MFAAAACQDPADPTFEHRDAGRMMSVPSLPVLSTDLIAFTRHGTLPAKRTVLASGRGHGLLHEAAILGRSSRVPALLALGNPVAETNADDQTALHLAAALDHAETAAVLLAHGARPSAADRFGRTPLHMACMFGGFETARVLLAARAEPNARDGWTWTPLHWAVSGANASLVELLLRHGADPMARDSRQRTPLSLADSKSERIRSILRAGSARNSGGEAR